MKLTVAKDVMDLRSWNADVVLGWLEEVSSMVLC